ncbi:hypothetical protein C1645_841377 [Glomus cerebriforme]|uniref:Uncharacterized protein n=1 Tax=Glomus cerebriforme TaxID=658196 RepID=A0A397S479_9GLOM|nr:hypothetical protein C1645_841377 [Glomus cerebriforme]
MDPTGNNFVPLQIPDNNNENNFQHTSINTITPAPQDAIFVVYLSLPNDTRIYRVTYQYTELHPLENVQLLNNRINIPDSQFPHHYNIQSLIQQQIQQQVHQPVVYQQNNIQQQSFDTMRIQPTSQINYSDNNANNNTSANGTISADMQGTGFWNSS